MDLCGRWVTDLVYEDNSLACLIPMHIMSHFQLDILANISQHPSVFKSNRLHVDIFWFSFINLEYTL